MLLTRAGVAFQVVGSRCDEERIRLPQPQMLAIERARAKAREAVLDPTQLGGQPCIAVGADTVVALGQEVFGSPADRADARATLTRLQGTTHQVFTGHACTAFAADGSQLTEAVALASARVTMRALTAAEIQAYVDSGESDGRAGAYAIQETGDRFVTDLQGGWDTVVGLNVAILLRLHQQCLDALAVGPHP
ncbi:MAG: Maf family protein [Planctomycetes bacterium]|nr:Maf family protein [Planctomycetota bacterium]